MARPSAEGSGGRPRGAVELSVLLARYGTRKVSLGHARPPAHVKLACPFHQLVARRAEHVDAAERLCCAAPRAAAPPPRRPPARRRPPPPPPPAARPAPPRLPPPGRGRPPLFSFPPLVSCFFRVVGPGAPHGGGGLLFPPPPPPRGGRFLSGA